MKSTLRICLVGGAISFRALVHWMTPWIYIPSLILAPIFQILLFAYLGRSAGVQDDQFYVIGNALQYSAIPCLFAMGQTISGERRTQTLGLVLSSPAPRVPLFVGRALPVIANGWVASIIALVVGSLILDVRPSVTALLGIGAVVAVASASCTGLGLVLAAVDLRVREGAVLNNIAFGILLIFTGANVALSSLPGWVAAVGKVLPLTHAIEAARRLARGDSLGDVSGLIGSELAIGAVYSVVALLMLRWLETSSRRHGTLETM